MKFFYLFVRVWILFECLGLCIADFVQGKTEEVELEMFGLKTDIC